MIPAPPSSGSQLSAPPLEAVARRSPAVPPLGGGSDPAAAGDVPAGATCCEGSAVPGDGTGAGCGAPVTAVPGIGCAVSTGADGAGCAGGLAGTGAGGSAGTVGSVGVAGGVLGVCGGLEVDGVVLGHGQLTCGRFSAAPESEADAL